MSGETLDLEAIQANLDAALSPSREEGIALVAEVRRLREDAARLDWVLADCIGEADEKAKFTDVYLPMLWVPTDKGVTPESLRAAIDKRIATGEDTAREAAHD